MMAAAPVPPADRVERVVPVWAGCPVLATLPTACADGAVPAAKPAAISPPVEASAAAEATEAAISDTRECLRARTAVVR